MVGGSRRASRTDSNYTDDAAATPSSSMALTTRHSSMRGMQTRSSGEAAQILETAQPTRIPQHYYLPPTVPSPFFGTLDACHDAIFDWGALNTATTPVKEALLKPVSTETNWPALLNNMIGQVSNASRTRARFLLEEFLFLVTRTLLPEQIAENRASIGRLYNRKKHLAIRLVLRYDMIREWCLGDGPQGRRDMSIPSVPPPSLTQGSSAFGQPSGRPANGTQNGNGYGPILLGHRRRELMPNIWPTLIAAPQGGYSTLGVRDRMKHYITGLDKYLLLTDEEVSEWEDKVLVAWASQIVLQWQWLCQSNQTLEDMEVVGWEELDGRAEECEWIAEKKEGSTVKSVKNSDKNGGKNSGEN